MNRNQTLCYSWIAALALIVIGVFSLFSGEPYLQEEWNTFTRFPVASVYDMAVSHDGYLWMATGNSLLRYDGSELKKILLPTKGNDNIKKIFKNSSGDLYVATRQDLLLYDHHHFVSLTGLNLQAYSDVSCLIDDTLGNLWLGLSDGTVSRYKNNKITLAKNLNSPIVGLWHSPDGVLWAATYDNGLHYYQDQAFIKQSFSWLDKSKRILSLHVEQNGCLWLGTQDGLLQVDHFGTAKRQRITEITSAQGLSDNQVTGIYRDSQNNLWVSTPNGVNRMTWVSPKKTEMVSFLPGVQVTSCVEDSEKNLWFGTIGHQCKRFRQTTFKMRYPFPGFSAYRPTLFCDKGGNMIIGTDDGKLVQVVGDGYTVFFNEYEKTGSAISSITEDQQHQLWVGTEGGKLLQLVNHQVVNRFLLHGHRKRSNPINTIYADSSQRVWVGTKNGLYCIQKGIPLYYSQKNGLPAVNILQIVEDNQKNIWIATEQGVLFLRNGEFNSRTQEIILHHKTVYCIYQEEKGSIWFGTQGEGLFCLHKSKLTRVLHVQGVPLDCVYQMQEDKHNGIWCATPNGVLKLTKSDLLEVTNDRKKKLDGLPFDTADGMMVAQCWFRSANSIQVDQEGRCWFATELGIAIVKPDVLILNKTPPPVVVEEVFFNDKAVSSLNQNGTFKGIESIRFEVKAVTFVFQERVKFKYQLEGYDNEWHELVGGPKQDIHFFDLPFGVYTLRVFACNGSGVWNTTGAQFTFELEPYYYQRPIFKLFAIFLVMCLGLAFFVSIKRYLLLKHGSDKSKNPVLLPDDAEECLALLLHLLKDEKIYRQDDISLYTLAERMGISHRHLSQLMMEKLGKHFWDVINLYRVEEAKILLTHPHENGNAPSVVDVGYAVGFSSKRAFYSAFKKITGILPADYKKHSSSPEQNK